MKRYIKSSSDSGISVKALIDRLIDIYHKKFPNSECLAALQYINEMDITLKPLLCADISDVGRGYFGNIADPFNIEIDIAFPYTSRGEIKLDTQIDSQYIFEVDIRCFHMDTGILFHEQAIPDPDASDCGMTMQYGYYLGNYESVISFWEHYVDNIYNTFMQLKNANNLPDYIARNSRLKSVVDSMK